MSTEVTQRELRNNSGDIMRGLDQGKTYVGRATGFRLASSRRCAGIASWPPRPPLPSLGAHRAWISSGCAAIWMRRLARTSSLVPDPSRPQRGILDASVVIDLEPI